ncbi:MAG: hypothetical protein ACYTGX_03295 [Planctomycetota bacterium]|jgi:hypothetical protein
MERLGADDARLTGPGSFGMLSHARARAPHFIGRHDGDVGQAVRALMAAGCPMCGIRLHGAQVEPRPTAAEAYTDECGLWHRYGPTDCNPAHPVPPAPDAACPAAGCTHAPA